MASCGVQWRRFDGDQAPFVSFLLNWHGVGMNIVASARSYELVLLALRASTSISD